MVLPPLRFLPHPITDRAWWNQVASDSRWSDWRAQITAWADAAPAKPERLEASELLSVRRRQDRRPGDRFTREARRALAALAIRRCLVGGELRSGDDDRLLDTLWAQVTEPSWTHQAHVGPRDLPPHDRPGLDLMATEQAAFTAELIELLGPWLAVQSDTLIATMVAAIDRQVLTPFGAGLAVGWDRDAPTNNWIGVCAGSILCTCESLAALGHPRPAARARALEGLRRYVVHAFTPDGECDEGIGYWVYGMIMASLGWTRLDPAEWPARERLARIADYPRRCHLFGDSFLSGNDSSLEAKAGLSFVPWLARGLQDEWLWSWSRRAPATGERHLGLLLRECEALAWCPPSGEAAPPAAPVYLADQQSGVLRNGRLVIALAGGTNAENHNHNDLGHVVVALDERFVLPDFGAPKPYPGDFFGPKRYGFLVAGSLGHSVPRINGCEQREGEVAAGKLLAWDGTRLALDLTAAYGPEAGLRSWTRELVAIDDGFALTDRFVLDRDGVVEHALWSVGSFAGNGLAITVEPAAAPVDVVHDMATHGVGHVFSEPCTRRAWTYAVRAGEELVVVTRISAA